jgi:hypothetical protein
MSDQDFGAFTGLVQAEDVYTNMTLAFRCPTCDRLYIFWRGMADDPVVYAPRGVAARRQRRALPPACADDSASWRVANVR